MSHTCNKGGSCFFCAKQKNAIRNDKTILLEEQFIILPFLKWFVFEKTDYF